MKVFLRYILEKKFVIIYWSFLIFIALVFKYWLHDSKYLAVDLLRTDFYDKSTIYQFTTVIFQSIVITVSLPISFMMIFTAFHKNKVYGVSVIKFIWCEPIAKIANLESLVFLCFSNLIIAYVCLAYNLFTGLIATFLFSLIFVIFIANHLLSSFLHTDKLEIRIKKTLEIQLLKSLNKGMEGESAPFFIFELFAHTRECIFAYDLLSLQKNFDILIEFFKILLEEEKDKENSILFMNYYSCMEGIFEDLANSKLTLESLRYTDDTLSALSKHMAVITEENVEFEYVRKLRKRFHAFIETLELNIDNGKFLFPDFNSSHGGIGENSQID